MICFYGNLKNLLQNFIIEKECNMMITYKNGDNGIVEIIKDARNNYKKSQIILGD